VADGRASIDPVWAVNFRGHRPSRVPNPGKQTLASSPHTPKSLDTSSTLKSGDYPRDTQPYITMQQSNTQQKRKPVAHPDASRRRPRAKDVQSAPPRAKPLLIEAQSIAGSVTTGRSKPPFRPPATNTLDSQRPNCASSHRAPSTPFAACSKARTPSTPSPGKRPSRSPAPRTILALARPQRIPR
jgi:hypothetical protein